MKKHICSILVAFSLSLQGSLGQTEVKVNPVIRYQELKGWGTSLCWWAVLAGGFSEAKSDEICRMITSPDELNMNVFRYNIGGGENPSHNHMRPGAEVPGFKSSSASAYDWNQDANQRKILKKLNALRKDAINEAFSNSPPYWMTKSGCASGNTDGSDNLKDDQYDDFAGYITEVVKWYKDNQAITFHTVDPFNEPFSGWWKENNNQEGCKFGQSNQHKMILELHKSLTAKNMLSYTKISAMDANSLDEAVNGINGYVSASNIMSKISQINAHSYSGSRRSELFTLSKIHKKELWQSESGPLGTNLSGLANNLFMAQRLIQDLRDMKPVVWCDWQLGAQNEPGWSLINMNYSTQAINRNKNFYVRMQCSRFIKQGYTIIESSNVNSVAAINPQGTELVVVVCNQATAANSFAFNLTEFNTVGTPVMYRTSANENCIKLNSPAVSNRYLNYNSPSESITTFVIPISLKSPLNGIYNIIARHSNKALQAANNESASIIEQRTLTNTSSFQKWNITPEGNFYKITNQATGMALDVNAASFNNGASIIQNPYLGNENQLWSLIDLGNGYYELLNKFSLKALDVSGSSLADGAQTIQYSFGNYNNQQFLLRSIITGFDKASDEDLDLSIFPNPFQKSFFINSQNYSEYAIIDNMGQTIESGNCSGKGEAGKYIPSGIYTLILKEEKGKFKSLKVIKE